MVLPQRHCAHMWISKGYIVCHVRFGHGDDGVANVAILNFAPFDKCLFSLKSKRLPVVSILVMG